MDSHETWAPIVGGGKRRCCSPPLKVKALQFIHPYATIVSFPIQCYNSKLFEYATIVSFLILTICDDGG